MAKFQLGLDEVRLQPVDRRARQLACADRLCSRAGNRFAGSQNAAVIAQHFGVADPGVDHRHMRGLMTENTHNRVQFRPALGQLRAYGMSKPVSADCGFAVMIDKPGQRAELFSGACIK